MNHGHSHLTSRQGIPMRIPYMKVCPRKHGVFMDRPSILMFASTKSGIFVDRKFRLECKSDAEEHAPAIVCFKSPVPLGVLLERSHSLILGNLVRRSHIECESRCCCFCTL